MNDWRKMAQVIKDLPRPISKRGSLDLNVINCSPNVGEGVFVFDTRDGGLTGLDAATGRELWKLRCWRTGAAVLRWVHRGKTYFITGIGQCVEPRTWQVRWTGSFGGTPAVCEDYLVTYGDDRDGKGMQIYRISPERAELLHTLSPRYVVCTWMGGPAIYRGHAYGLTEDKGGDGWTLFAVELATGKVTSTKHQGRFAMSYWPVVADGRLWGQGISMFKAAPTDFVNLGVLGSAPGTTENYAVGTSCAYADGRVFYRGNDCLLCYDFRAKTRDAP